MYHSMLHYSGGRAVQCSTEAVPQSYLCLALSFAVSRHLSPWPAWSPWDARIQSEHVHPRRLSLLHIQNRLNCVLSNTQSLFPSYSCRDTQAIRETKENSAKTGRRWAFVKHRRYFHWAYCAQQSVKNSTISSWARSIDSIQLLIIRNCKK